MIGLFAIDDHYLIIEGLFKAFNSENEEFRLVGSASNVEEAIKKIPGTDTDIIILDLFVDNNDPVANFRLLRKNFPSIPVVILTMEDSLRWQIKMFKLGVMGFLNKNEKIETLKSVLTQVSNGNLVIPDKVSKSLISKSMYSK